MNSTQSLSYLSALNSDFIYFEPPANTSLYGVGQAQLVVSLKDYPSIVKPPISFTATLLGSEAPSITNQIYIINSEPLAVVYDTFKVLPQGYPTPSNTIKAYVVD